MASMFAAIVTNVLLPTKQIVMDVSAMMLGPVTDLVNATSDLMVDLYDLLEKVIILLTG